MKMRKPMQCLLAAALIVTLLGASARASVATLRALMQTDPNILHQYSFEGANDAERQQDKAGSLDLSVSSYGGGAPIVYAAGLDASTTALNPGVTATVGSALRSGSLTLGTAVTIEALIAPDGSVGEDNQYAVSTGGGGNRGYFMLQREGDLKTAVGGSAFADGDALRDYTSTYTTGDWYYLVGTFEIAGGNTTFNSWTANLSDATPTLVKTNDNVVISGEYQTSPTNLAVGMFTAGTNEAFDGSIDEVGVYGAAMDEFTVQRHFSAVSGTEIAIYREIFPNDTGSDSALSGDGWQINSDAGALAGTQINSWTDGTPIDQPAVNSNPDSTELARGYAFNNDTNGVDYLFWTDEYTVNHEAWDITEISWYQSNESTSDTSRAAIQIGGQWYASDQTFNNTTGHFAGSGGELMSLDFTTADWRLLDFLDGSSLALGSAATLPIGDITKFGVYYDGKSGRLRMDTFTISGVATLIPTPAALPAGLALLGMMGLRRRLR